MIYKFFDLLLVLCSYSTEICLQHDNTAPVISKFKSIGASKPSNPRQLVFTIDHDVQNKSPTNLKKYANIEQFAHLHDVDFYPPGRGIGVSEGQASFLSLV